MDERNLHPTMHPLRPREERVRVPRLPRGVRRSAPTWRGRYVHAPRGGPYAQRVIVKTSWHPRGSRGFKSMTAATAYHLRYMRREHELTSGVERSLYTQERNELTAEERTAFTQRTKEDPHQWHMIISPANRHEVDITQLTRDVLTQMEQDTRYRLDWIAANHYNTEHPHSHVVIRGKDLDGHEVGLKRDYITHGLPYRAMDLATEQVERRRAHGYERTRDQGWDRTITQELDRG